MRNKNLIAAVVLILLGAGGVFVFSGKIGQKNKQPLSLYEKTAASLLSSNTAEQATLDTDGDGLRDWEEILWKTNPGNPDTDGDGFTDREEISQGYDPLDPTSNPTTGKKMAKDSYADEEFDENISITQEFSRAAAEELINPSAETSEVNTLDPFSLISQQASQNLLHFMNSFNQHIPESEIKISTDNSVSGVERYFKEVGKAIPANPYPGAAEDDIFTEAIEKRNFKKIDEYINYYDTAINNMKKITVPSDFLQIHKREIELFMATKKVYQSIKKINDDPLKTVLALQENEKIRKEMQGLVTEFLELAQKHYGE